MDYVRRSAWGARPPLKTPTVIATPTKWLYLHHSAGPDGGVTTIQQIQRFHQDTRGWNDIAYTFLYSPRDRVFYEGRGPGIAQSAQVGFNRTAHSVCVLGNFQTVRLPETAVQDLAEMARWHGAHWGPNEYVPHRATQNTACPGQNIMVLLDEINRRAQLGTGETTGGDAMPRTLRLGMEGEDVRTVQKLLLLHDGVFDPDLEYAVRRFQAINGLTVDGVVGPKTWAALSRL